MQKLIESEHMDNGFGNIVPPLLEHVLIYFSEKGLTEKQALSFFEYYQRKRWHNNRGKIIKDWKMRAWQWIWKSEPTAGGADI